MRTARKLLILALVAFGAFGASSTPALAANCTVSPMTPSQTPSGPHPSGITLPTHLACTDVIEFQWVDRWSRSVDSSDWNTVCANPNGNGCDIYFPNWVANVGPGSSFTFDTYIYDNCPGPPWLTGWWGHYAHFRIKGYTSGTWGSYHDSPRSLNAYFQCVN